MAVQNILEIAFICFAVLEGVKGHGRMTQPPGRATMWRYGFNTPPDYNDHQLYCGGLQHLWDVNNGKCGVCGDPYDQAQPRDHEAGSKYGTGTIVRTYKQGEIITVKLEITANHGGHFEFHICPTNNAKVIATEECMNRYQLRLANGQLKYALPTNQNMISVDVALPAGLACSQCVFRWKYYAAQNVGFGARQEHFYSCADVTIGSGGSVTPAPPIPTTTTRPIIQTTRLPIRTPGYPVPITTTKYPVPPPTNCPPGCTFYCRVLKICNLPNCEKCVY